VSLEDAVGPFKARIMVGLLGRAREFRDAHHAHLQIDANAAALIADALVDVLNEGACPCDGPLRDELRVRQAQDWECLALEGTSGNDWVIDWIVRSVRLVGPLPPPLVPASLLLSGAYQGVLAEAGVEVPLIEWDPVLDRHGRENPRG